MKRVIKLTKTAEGALVLLSYDRDSRFNYLVLDGHGIIPNIADVGYGITLYKRSDVAMLTDLRSYRSTIGLPHLEDSIMNEFTCGLDPDLWEKSTIRFIKKLSSVSQEVALDQLTRENKEILIEFYKFVCVSMHAENIDGVEEFVDMATREYIGDNLVTGLCEALKTTSPNFLAPFMRDQLAAATGAIANLSAAKTSAFANMYDFLTTDKEDISPIVGLTEDDFIKNIGAIVSSATMNNEVNADQRACSFILTMVGLKFFLITANNYESWKRIKKAVFDYFESQDVSNNEYNISMIRETLAEVV